VEIEEQRYGRNKSTAINHAYIESGEYRRKFNNITKDDRINKLLYQLAKKMLIHRSGTMIEDMYWIDPVSIKVIASETAQREPSSVIYSGNTIKTIHQYDNLITIHSHPESFPPSAEDFASNYDNNYALGIVACHDGKVFAYSSNTKISAKYIELAVMSYKNKYYDDYNAQIMAIKELEQQFEGMIFMRELI
jgi:hypothetical protein